MANLLPAALACLILGAHFLRWGRLVLVFVVLLLPLLAVILRKRWTLRALQGVLSLGSVLWLATAARLGRERLAAGEPWLRLALILGGVAVFTAFSAWRLSRPSLRERFPD